MNFGLVSVTAKTDSSLMVPLSVTAVSRKTTFGRSLNLEMSRNLTPFREMSGILLKSGKCQGKVA